MFLLNAIVGRGVLSPPLFKFCPNLLPLPCQLQPPLLFLLSCFLAEWMITPHLMCYSTEWYYGSTHVKPWYLSTRRTLMCVLCNKVSSLLGSDTWYGFLLVLWFNITHTNTHTHTHTHKHTTHNFAYIISFVAIGVELK